MSSSAQTESMASPPMGMCPLREMFSSSQRTGSVESTRQNLPSSYYSLTDLVKQVEEPLYPQWGVEIELVSAR